MKGKEMRLKTFKFIDEVIQMKNDMLPFLEEMMETLKKHFAGLLEGQENFIHVTGRIKSDESLQEKIIRQNYPKHFQDAGELFSHMPDIVGIRVECRFIDDEQEMYNAICESFEEREDGLSYSLVDPRIALNLKERQPLTQRNGFGIYRIDGKFFGEKTCNFELQIKSIVNLFWGEIDHKILYKNFDFVVSEDFVRQIMSTIKGNLFVVDRQMKMLYEHMKKMEDSSQYQSWTQMKEMLGKMLHDIYIVRLREELGLVVDFRNAIYVITDYVFAKVKYESRENYAAEFVRLMDDALAAGDKEIHFGEVITFDEEIKFSSGRAQAIAEKLYEQMNEDLLWNMILNIVFDLNAKRKKEEEFKTFVDYLYFILIHSIRKAFRAKKVDMKYNPLPDYLIDEVIAYYCENLEPEYFTPTELLKLQEITEECLEEWLHEGRDNEKCVQNFIHRVREQIHFGGDYGALDS